MKNTKKLSVIALCLAATCVFAACTQTEFAPQNSDDFIERPAFMCVDTQRHLDGVVSDADVVNDMLEQYAPFAYNGVAMSIVSGIPVSAARDDGSGYLFKVTDNLTGHDCLPEYITIDTRFGTSLVIGKEYVVYPVRNYNTLWDSYTVANWFDVIARDLVSDREIDRIREVGERRHTAFRAENTVVENTSLSQDFVSNVDLVVVLRVTDKRAESRSDKIWDITFDIVEIVQGAEHRTALRARETIRVNFDVEVGGTYMVMLDVFGESSFLPSARNGAIINEASADFAQYRSAFSELALAAE